eukprot:11015265-Alexandrium_andersonii.AAC.1
MLTHGVPPFSMHIAFCCIVHHQGTSSIIKFKFIREAFSSQFMGLNWNGIHCRARAQRGDVTDDPRRAPHNSGYHDQGLKGKVGAPRARPKST